MELFMISTPVLQLGVDVVFSHEQIDDRSVPANLDKRSLSTGAYPDHRWIPANDQLYGPSILGCASFRCAWVQLGETTSHYFDIGAGITRHSHHRHRPMVGCAASASAQMIGRRPASLTDGAVAFRFRPD